MMEMNCSLVIGFIIIVCANPIVGWRPFRIEKFNITATSLSADIEMNATITGIDETSIYVNLKKTLQHPFAKIEFYFDSGNGLFDLKFINETIDVCRFFRDKKYLPVVQLVYKSYAEQGNFPTSCPIKKNLYVGKSMRIDVEKLPPTLPNKQIYYASTLLSNEGSDMKPLAFYRIYTRIVKDI